MTTFVKEKYLLLLFFLLLIVAANAQNFVVNSTIDAVDSNPGNGICDDGLGNCPIRAAILESNALGGAHTITLPAGIHTLTIGGVGENASATGDLDVTSNITINGVSPSVTIIDVNNIDRVFHILPVGVLTMSNTTIKNGNTLKDHGGGFLNEGILSINYCHITENTSTLPVGATYSGGFGGGIANFGNLTIENSTLFLNKAIGGRGTNGQNGGGGGGSTPGFGGAIYNNLNGLITLKNTTISENIARGGRFSAGSTNGGNFNFAGKRGAGSLGGVPGFSGGGAGGNGGDFSGGGGGGSSGSFGGFGGMGGYGAGGGGRGARSGSGTSPGSGGLNGFGGGQGCNPCCSSGGGGGGGAGFGGGIFNNGGTITSINSSIAFNSAYGGQGQRLNSIGGYAAGGTPGQGLGGGIFNRSSTVDLSNTLIASNTNYNDILNSNTSGIASNEDLYGTFTSTNGHNLIFNIGSGVLTGNTTGNIIGQDPLISSLANNGGSTHTIKIATCPASPAIDAGLDAVAPALDQRDFPRLNNYGGANIVDIGAFESTDTLFYISGSVINDCGGLNIGQASANPIGGSSFFTFQWDFLAANQTTQTAINLGAGNYTVTVSDTNGCSKDTTFTILNQSTNSGNDNDTILCVGDTTFDLNQLLSLGVDPGIFTETTFSGQFNSLSGILITTGLAGTYSFIYETQAISPCISDTAFFNVTVNPIPAAPTVANISICTNNSATLTATLPVGNYQWFDSISAVNVLDTSYTFTTPILTSTKSYYVQTTINGCVSPITTVIVSVDSNLIVDAGLTAVICEGDSFDLNADPFNAAYSYSWDEPANLNFSNLYNPTVSPLQTTLYMLTVSNPNNCVGIDSIEIRVIPKLNVLKTLTNPLCNGGNDGQINLIPQGGSAPYSYSWNTSPIQITNTITNLAAGNYTVTVTDNFGCFVDSTFTLIDPLGFSFTTDFLNSNCGLPDGSVSVLNFTGGFPNYNYNWGSGPTTNNTLSSLLPGTYSVTVTDANNCDTNISITISPGNNLPFMASIDAKLDVICFGESSGTATAIGSDPSATYSFSWNSAPTQITQTATNLPAGQYICTLTDNITGCIDTTLVNIVEPTQLTVSAGNDASICFGENTNISAIAAGGTPPYNFFWDNSLGTAQNYSVSPIITTTYLATLNDACLYYVEDSVTINVNPLPVVDFTAANLILCEIPQLPFELTNLTPNSGSVTWDFGDGTTGSTNVATHSYNSPGSYDVTLTVINSAAFGSCLGSLTKPNYLQFFTNPTADFNMNPNPTTMFDPTVRFYDQSVNNITNWNWDFGGLMQSSSQNPFYTFPVDTGNYVVTLTVTDINGCGATNSKNVVIQGEYGVFIPNAFTPNGDGLNDELSPNGFGILDQSYKLFIFTRWGELIFQSNSKFQPWDGVYKGNIVENGEYLWKLEFTDINNKVHNKVGHVNVIR